jgi:hypothetical protein
VGPAAVSGVVAEDGIVGVARGQSRQQEQTLGHGVKPNTRHQLVRSVSDMAKAQDERIPLRFAAMSDTPAIEVNR